MRKIVLESPEVNPHLWTSNIRNISCNLGFWIFAVQSIPDTDLMPKLKCARGVRADRILQVEGHHDKDKRH